jgi:hypothetical protein
MLFALRKTGAAHVSDGSKPAFHLLSRMSAFAGSGHSHRVSLPPTADGCTATDPTRARQSYFDRVSREGAVSELDPKDAFYALWVDIIRQRNNLPSRLSQAISKIDMAVWPAPVIRMFLGQMTPAAVLAAADDPDVNKKKDQVCDANFYGGELALRTGAKDEAARLFRLAARDCPRSTVEWSVANAELKALGVAR